MKSITRIILFTFMFICFTSFTYAQSTDPVSAASEPIPFTDQGPVFVTLESLQADLSSQLSVDFSDLNTKDKKIYTFKNGLMTQLELPLLWQEGHFGFQVKSSFSGVLCELIVHDKKGLYNAPLTLKRLGDGSYAASIPAVYEPLKNMPLQYNLILVSRAVPIDNKLKFSLTKLSDLLVARTKDMSVNTEIGPALQEMFKASSKANSFELTVVSGYRSVAKQQSLFNAKMATLKKQGVSNPYEAASKTVNPPTQSEHHTGYATDILSNRISALGAFKGSSEAKWLEANSYKYGFVVRYPSGKTHITGISYEPWHFRYVGKDFAKQLKENKLTLEEWLDKGKKGTLYTSADGKSHYFVVLPSNLKINITPAKNESTQTKLFYISPGWVAYDMTL